MLMSLAELAPLSHPEGTELLALSQARSCRHGAADRVLEQGLPMSLCCPLLVFEKGRKREEEGKMDVSTPG